MREAILLTVAHPAVGAALLALGWAGIAAEFLQPGKVLPGAVGGVLSLLGLWSLLPAHAGLAAVVAAPLVSVTLGLFTLGWRVRKQKLAGFANPPAEPRRKAAPCPAFRFPRMG